MSARRIVTLPPLVQGAQALAWTARARAAGAEAVELRSDLHLDPNLEALAALLPLVVSERGHPPPPEWLAAAKEVDRPVEAALREGTTIVSLHATAPMSPSDAAIRWPALPPRVWVKHVEPLGGMTEGGRLLETQARLRQRFGDRVTVLATGEAALPFRCLLAERNALDYLALDETWSAAAGQRLLEDAVRASRAPPGAVRRAIIGNHIPHSRSPRVHPPPFDRLDLPPRTPLGPLLETLGSFYGGFAVTSPFKRAAAEALGLETQAVNTLFRREGRWEGLNTDVDGAARVLSALGPGPVTLLGDGGAAVALKEAAGREGRELAVVRRADLPDQPVSGRAVWTWPAQVDPPAGLRFANARVAVITYGRPARRISDLIRERGGEPLRLGAAWFVAQVRGQRRAWGLSA